MRSVAIAEPLFRQRAGVIELNTAPEDVMILAYGRLLVAVEHLFPGRRKKETVHPLTLLIYSPSNDGQREREGERA